MQGNAYYYLKQLKAIYKFTIYFLEKSNRCFFYFRTLVTGTILNGAIFIILFDKLPNSDCIVGGSGLLQMVRISYPNTHKNYHYNIKNKLLNKPKLLILSNFLYFTAVYLKKGVFVFLILLNIIHI